MRIQPTLNIFIQTLPKEVHHSKDAAVTYFFPKQNKAYMQI